MTGQFLPEAMLPASSVFKKCCNYQCLIFVFDIETDGAPVSAPRTLCVIDCECTVCDSGGVAHADNPVGIPEFGGVWAVLEWRPGRQPMFVRCARQWQFFEFNERARVFRMDARAQKCHGISLQVCHCLN